MSSKIESGSVPNINSKVENIVRKYALINELSNLLIGGKLATEKINQEAEKLGVSTSKLSY